MTGEPKGSGMQVWRLTIERHSGLLTVNGSYDVLQEAVREWREWLQLDEHSQLKDPVLKVEGMCDSADRSELTVYAAYESIIGMVLLRVW